MIWDGMAFFSVNGYHKLKRMKDPSRKTKCYDRYKTPESIVFGFFYFIACILVIVFEISKYGTIASIKVDLVTEPSFEYNINLGLPVMYGVWMHFKQLA